MFNLNKNLSNMLLFISLVVMVLPGCIKQSKSTSKESFSGQTTFIHGVEISDQQKNQLIASLGTFSSGTLPPDTQLAQVPDDNLSGTGFALDGEKDEYIEACKAAGVPIPPPWSDQVSWKEVGEIKEGRLFISNAKLKTTLYTYQTEQGVCAALPRYSGDILIALGMICQGNSGKACFWDNIERTAANPGGKATSIRDPDRIRPEIMANGYTSTTNCTDCHRGNNVFIVHEDTFLNNIPNRDVNQYEPLGQNDWNNGLFDDSLKIPQCSQCHKIASLNYSYCNFVLLPSIVSYRTNFDFQTKQPTSYEDIHLGRGAAMPPDGHDRSEYLNEINYLMSECKGIYDKEQKPWGWSIEKPTNVPELKSLTPNFNDIGSGSL